MEALKNAKMGFTCAYVNGIDLKPPMPLVNLAQSNTSNSLYSKSTFVVGDLLVFG